MKFYSSMRDKVDELMPCPKILGQFEDPVDPQTFFCIAMEDLTVKYNTCSIIDGMTKT